MNSPIWKSVPLSSCIDKVIDFRGKTPKKIGMEWGNGSIRALSANNVKQGYIDFKRECYLASEELYDAWMTKGDCSKGDIVFTMEAPLGNVALIPDDNKYILSQRVILLKPNESVLSEYLFHFMSSESFQNELNANATGSTAKGIKQTRLVKLKVTLPPAEEQQKIAEVLSTVDKKIDLIDQKIAETEKLKTGLMQKLFSEGIGVQDENGDWQPHAEFEDNGLPMHWGFLKLGSVAKVTSGGTPSRKKASFWENGTIPWITTGEVNFNCITNSSQKITDEGLKNSAAKMFPPDTILMAMYGQGQTRGRVAMLGIEASTNQACAAIICSKKLNPHFCYHYLSSQYEKIRAIGNEGSQKNLNGQIIKDILIPCPNLEEQEQIALVLSTVDEKITLLAKQKSETQQLKKGLMQKLLTGEWRVPVEETEAA